MAKVKKYLFMGIILGCLIPNVFVFAQNNVANPDVIILNSKIDLLEKLVNQNINTTQWVVGSFILIFVAIMGLNILSNHSINKNKIMTIKEELKNLIDSKNDSAQKYLKELLEKNTKKLEESASAILEQNQRELKKYREELFLEIKKQEDRWSAENSRNMAYNCAYFKSFAFAFMYSLDAAFYFEKTGNTSLPSAWLDTAEDNLRQGTIYDYDAKFFEENLKDIRDNISSLKDKHEIRILRIEKLLEERINNAKQVSLLPSPK